MIWPGGEPYQGGNSFLIQNYYNKMLKIMKEILNMSKIVDVR